MVHEIEPVLLVDMGAREQYRPHLSRELFAGAGTLYVYNTTLNWKSLLRNTVEQLRAGRLDVTRLLSQLRLYLLGHGGENADPSVRADFMLSNDWRIHQLRPGLVRSLPRVLREFASPRSWRAVGRLRAGEFANVVVGDVDISGYVVDSLLRFRKAPAFFLGPGFPAQVAGVWWLSKYVTMARFANTIAQRYRFRTLLTNHVVYCEAGMIAHQVKATLGNHVTVKQAQEVYPEFVTVDRLPSEPYLALTHRYLEAADRTDIGSPPKPIWYPDHQDAPVAGSKPVRVVLAMHCLTDANNVHDNGATPFPSFFDWIRYSIELARSHPDLELLIRLHPDRRLYGGHEERLYARLFADLPPNCRVLAPDDPAGNPLAPGSVTVTFSGSIALEMACLGRRAVVVGDPLCPESCYEKIRTRDDYVAFLVGGFRDFDDSLDPQEVAGARNYRRALHAWVQSPVGV